MHLLCTHLMTTYIGERTRNWNARGCSAPALHALTRNIIHSLVGIISASTVVCKSFLACLVMLGIDFSHIAPAICD